MNGLILDLQRLIRQPSVSARNQGIIECASLVASIMSRAGISTEILHIDPNYGWNGHTDKDAYDNVHPIVFGEVKSKANPDGKTILFYNHYDVQPEDPIELWNENPFSGKIEGNYI